jgi:8-oxo-dGTP pyrophosphatase MutT (NUDIX family)
VNRAQLVLQLQQYQGYSSEEESARLAMLELLASEPDCFSRSSPKAHFTASAWVLDRAGERAVLLYHRKLSKWLQPGGHADGDQNLPAVALKEAQEETGLTALSLLSSDIFDLDVHQIPAQAGIEQHFHYDVRFLVGVTCENPSAETLLQNSESRALAWCSLAQVLRLTQEQSVLRMLRKWQARRAASNAMVSISSSPPPVRDYQELVLRPFQQCAAAGKLQLTEIGESVVGGKRYPLLRVEAGSPAPGRDSVLLTAGIHGDEPAGVLALRDFLTEKAAGYLSRYHFLAYPCINPYGFEHDQRASRSGVDLNRCFLSDCLEPEVQSLTRNLELSSYPFSFAIDLHEDNPVDPTDIEHDQSACLQPTAFYLYENCQHAALRIGKAIVELLRDRKYQVCDLPLIWGDLNEGGVIRYGEASTNAAFLGVNSFATFLCRSRTDLCLTFETYAASSLRLRIETQLAAIQAALEVRTKVRTETYVGDGL